MKKVPAGIPGKTTVPEREDEVIRLLNEGYTHREIADKMSMSLKTITKIRNNMDDIFNEREGGLKKGKNPLTVENKEKLKILDGLSVNEIKQLIHQKELTTKKDINQVIGVPGKLKLGVISDTHLNNQLCKIDHLKAFYELCGKEGVDAIVHAGDLTDGIDIYPGQIYELINTSFDKQAEYINKNYPKIDDVKTYFISGNHDEGWLKKAGINFGDTISKLREDMIHLGFYNAKIHLNGFCIELQHGGGSSPYAVSYHMQKYLERVPITEPVDIYVLGHYHRELFMYYRGTAAFLPGAFLGENLLAKRYKLGNNIAGRIVSIERNKKGKIMVDPKLIKYE